MEFFVYFFICLYSIISLLSRIVYLNWIERRERGFCWVGWLGVIGHLIIEKYYIHNIFIANRRWWVVLSYNLNPPLKLNFFFFFWETNTHTRKRERGSNTKAYHLGFVVKVLWKYCVHSIYFRTCLDWGARGVK